MDVIAVLAACERNTMAKRIITGACLIAVLIPLLIFSDTWAFPISLSIVSMLCVFEMLRCIGFHKNVALTLPLYAFALAFPPLLRFFKEDVAFVAKIAIMCVMLYLIYLFAFIIFSHGKILYSDALTMCVTVFYILLAINTLIYIRDFEKGQYIYLLTFIGAWVTDTFAYFTGVFFGKHKLIEDVSPKKTIEGSVGGTLFCAIGFVVLGLIVGAIDTSVEPNLVFLAISGILIAIISQLGDLIMSVIKRHYGIKDYGKLLPGHGGVLDRFDSILAVSLGVASMCIFSSLTNITLL